jgi:hypothetical protein
MVENTRAQARTNTFRTLNRPNHRKVLETAAGIPKQVLLRNQWTIVADIEDCWRVDDEWWRTQPISRMYYQVRLEDGRFLTLFRDLTASQWYEQRYV